MRIIAIMITIVVALLPVAAEARRAQPVAAPVQIQDVSLAQTAVPVEIVVPAADYVTHATRNGFDVRYGPADSMVSTGDTTVSVWRVNGDGRDSAMRTAGISRITVVQTAISVRIMLAPIARLAAPVVLASAN